MKLLNGGRVAIVTALSNCDAGGRALISLTLEQGEVSDAATADVACESQLIRVEITVAARGPSPFVPGGATAKLEEVVRNRGVIIEDQHWSRAVTLAPK